MLELHALTKTFGDKTAVDAATFSVDRPMMIGIIGRSGAGKSTLLRMLNRLSDATSGRIVFDGQEISMLRGQARRSWQSRCAMIFQQFNLVPRLDVLTNVMLGQLNHRSTVSSVLNMFTREERAMASGQAASYVDRSASSLPEDIREKITRRRRPGDPEAALDPLADPEVKAAIARTRFEMLVGFQLSADQLAYTATR